MRRTAFTLIEPFDSRRSLRTAHQGSRNGFTLIELLVVIAIIALLVTILMPTLQQAKALAKQAVCMSHKHSIGLAAALYASEHDGAVPSAPSWTKVPDREQRPWYWFHLPENFGTLGDRRIAKCPADPQEDMSLTGGFCGAYEPHIGGFADPQRDAPSFDELHSPPGWGDGSKLTLLQKHKATRPMEILFITCTGTDWGGTFTGANKFGRFHAGQQKAVWLAHPSGTSGLFVDGHSDLLDEVELLDCYNGGFLTNPDDYGIYEYWDRDGIASWR
jgi:prepilin-type N-terminal cleavage/methylation domain-containing protein